MPARTHHGPFHGQVAARDLRCQSQNKKIRLNREFTQNTEGRLPQMRWASKIQGAENQAYIAAGFAEVNLSSIQLLAADLQTTQDPAGK